jgi:hypothetical protein
MCFPSWFAVLHVNDASRCRRASPPLSPARAVEVRRRSTVYEVGDVGGVISARILYSFL